MCTILNEANYTYLIVDKTTRQYLKNNKSIQLIFNGKSYKVLCDYLKQYNDQYIYQTNLDLKLIDTNIGYILIDDLSLWHFLQ